MKKPNLLICSAQDAVNYVLSHFSDPKTGRPPMTNEKYAAISIQDSNGWNYGFTLNQNRFCYDALTLIFDDIEEPETGRIQMNEFQAELIITFLRQYEKADTILIHCFAGKSRSAAIGKFAAELYGLPEPYCPYYNTWVYQTLHNLYEKIKFTECSEN